GMFVLLAMLKTAADRYRYAPLNILFICINDIIWSRLDKYIRLWSMRYYKHVLYNFVREKKILVSVEFRDREEQLEPLVYFFFDLKNRLEETMDIITSLKNQLEEKEKCCDSENNSQIIPLSDIICPVTFKLSFSTHGQHFAKEYFKSLPESD
ncbi:hypothetical protein EDC94DRAFT_528985, partial [Helicostylum pulchrum]